MKGIKFGNYHTFKDFGLIVRTREISAPTTKTNFVNVEGADGSLDFTEAFGDVHYDRRELSFTVSSLVPRSEFWKTFSKVQNTLHGREFHITDDEDSNYYYIGRISIDKWSIDKVVGSFTIKCNCEPYKYHLQETKRIESITGTKMLSFKNDRLSVTPILTATSPMIIEFDGNIINITSSDVGKELYSSAIKFKEGNNIMKVSGEGTLTIRYQEGSL